jgi:transposase
MRLYTDDLRQKVLHAVDTHQGSYATLARIFGVSVSWIKGVVRAAVEKRAMRTPCRTPAAHSAHTLTPALLSWLRLTLAREPDHTQNELRRRLWVERGVAVSQPTLSRALAALSLTRQKRPSTPARATRRRAPRRAPAGAPRWPGSRPNASSRSTSVA